MKRKIGLTLIIICMLLLFVACGKKDTIEGTWSAKDGTIVTFNEDGTGEWEDSSGSQEIDWSADSEELKIRFHSDFSKAKMEYYFLDGDLKLRLDAIGETWTLERVEED